MNFENIDFFEGDKKFEDIKSPEELLVYMENIKYGYVGKNNHKIYDYDDKDFDMDFEKEYYLQTPEQLLKSKHGVCWDQVELERDWFLKHHYDFKVFYLAFLKEAANNLPTHTFLTYKKNDKRYWFEHSFGDCKGIHEYENLKELMDDVKKKHLLHAIKEGGVEEKDFNDLRFCEYEVPAFSCSPNEFMENMVKNHEPLADVEGL
jgi:hypothetical protein